MKRALQSAGLPADDIREDITSFFRLDEPAGHVGWAALERYGPEALLRSVLIVDRCRGSGTGSDLVRRVAQVAAEGGVRRLWLLTETAAAFFSSLGFERVDRDAAPQAIRQGSEFLTVCPSSAECMTLKLASQ